MPFSFYLREESRTQSGECIIQIRYTYAGQKYRAPALYKGGSNIKAPCDQFIKPKEYASLKKSRKIKASDRPQRIRQDYMPLAPIANQRLDELEKTASNIILVLNQTGAPSVKRFKAEWELAQGKSRVFGVFDKYIEAKEKAKKSESTIRNLRKLRKRLIEFNQALRFSSFDEMFWKNYSDHYKGVLRQNTLILEQSNIIAFLNWSHGVYHQNSDYKGWQRKKKTPRKIFLTPAELMRFESVREFEEPEDERIKDIFLWLCHTGMRISEYMQLTKESLQGEVITYLSSKKGVNDDGEKIIKENKIQLSPTLDRLWSKYSGDLPKYRGNQLPRINRRLKVLAIQAGIEKRLMTSVGRHTFGSLMELWGVDTKTTSGTLGHDSERTTKENYTHTKRINEGAVIFDMMLRQG